LISYDKEAIEWGRELFEWYLKQAERIIGREGASETKIKK
jgi:predicted transcriptional regulator